MRVLFILIFSTSFLFAQQTEKNEEGSLYQRFLSNTGIGQEIEEIPQFFLPLFNESLAQVKARVFDEKDVTTITDSLLQVSRSIYETSMTDADMQTVIEWFQIPFSRKFMGIRDVNATAYTAEDSLRVSNMSALHRATIDSVVISMKFEELFTPMTNVITSIILEARIRQKLLTENKSSQEIEAFLEGEKYSNMVVNSIAQNSEILSTFKQKFYFQFSTFEVSEIEVYLKFNRTEPGRKFTQAMVDILGSFFDIAFNETRKRFKVAVQNQAEGAKTN